MHQSQRSKALYRKLAQGWNTWDPRSLTTHVLLPEKVAITLSLFIPCISAYHRQFLWPQVVRFGEHALRGEYTQITLKEQGIQFSVETAWEGDQWVMRVTPEITNPYAFFAIELHPVWGGKINSAFDQGRLIATLDTERSDCLIVQGLQKPGESEWNPCTHANMIYPAYQPLYVSAMRQRTHPLAASQKVIQTIEEVDTFLSKKHQETLSTILNADGALGEGIEAMRRCLIWNTIYDPHHQRVVTPVSRQWCQSPDHFGDYAVFGWDTFFAALMFGYIDKDLAYANLYSILQEKTESGMIPNFGTGNGTSRDRSEPQVGSWCAYKLYLRYHEIAFLEEVFDDLLAWNRWRFEHRDGNHDGLMELGSDPIDKENPYDPWAVCETGKMQGAMWESGLDNSPMWDHILFNEELHCMELSYVGLNALMVVDCEILAKIAGILGRTQEQEELRWRHQQLSEAINEKLWCEEKGMYLNRLWDGAFSQSLSPTHFYTWMAGIPDERKTQRMLEEHLLNPDKFWGEWVIPTISRDDPAFSEQHYWRGRIWPPTNFLVCEGLRRIGRWDLVEQLAEKSLELFVRCYRNYGFVGENYHALTGEAAEPGASSDKFYHWGGLMVMMMLQQALDDQPWNDETRIGSLAKEIRNLPLISEKEERP